MSQNGRSDRRTFLAYVSAIAAGGIAGCASGDVGVEAASDEDGSDASTGTPADAETPGEQRAPGETGASTGTETATPTDSSTRDPSDAGDYLVLEDFGSGGLNGDTWAESRDDGVEATSDGVAFHGEYGVRLNTDSCERIASGPTMDEPLAAYPRPGETVDLFHRLGDPDFGANEDSWLYFGMQEYPTSNGFTDDAYERGYVLRNDALGGRFDLRRVDAGESGLDATVLDGTDHTYDADRWYRMEVDWADSTPDVVATLYEVTTDDWDGTRVARVSADDTTYASEGAIVLVAERGGQFDVVRRVDPST